MNSEAYDYLICIAIENTEERIENSPHRFLYLDKSKDISPSQVQLDSFPSTIEFDWCSYDLKSQLVTEESNNFIRPTLFSSFTEAAQGRTGVSIADCTESVSLYEVIMNVLARISLAEHLHLQHDHTEEQVVRLRHVRGLGVGAPAADRVRAEGN
eukprot:TRINITY_DN6150_c0_g1_i7.p2 TRINITY_DN6150_c0_g1~~TRINITY_DN6150_c0_g1_i7.p2  ORF type:complete len:155 (-),score=33.69 TRINITY_DN6150_c0_g1_i7:310-774(-)